jgi:protein-S-isoprenylcysteine O-methyltransferase Ste14
MDKQRARRKGLELRIPPVVVAAAAAAAMWLAATALPSWKIEFGGRCELATLLAVLAATTAAAGIVSFRRARTTANPMRPDAASALVVTGIYRYTRNPMYLGGTLALLAWAVWLAQPLALLGVPAFVAWMNRFQIAPEERALRAIFGDSFERYCSEVRRWL